MRILVGIGAILTTSMVWTAQPSLPTRQSGAGVHPPHELDFDFTTRQPIVPTRVNGGRTVPFVVDTGASINVIDENVAREVGLTAGDARTLSGGGQISFEAKLMGPLTLEAGGIMWDAQHAAVGRLGYPETKHFAGLLGAPILMRYAAQFDYEKRKLRLFDPAAYTPTVGAVLVPFELQDDLPIVHATVDAGTGPLEARLMVDTGAGLLVDLNRPFVDANGLLQAIPDSVSTQRPAGLGGTAPVIYGIGRRVTLGGIVFDRPRLGMSQARAGSSSRGERDGIIGNDLLRQFVVTVDYSRRRVVLERPPR